MPSPLLLCWRGARKVDAMIERVARAGWLAGWLGRTQAMGALQVKSDGGGARVSFRIRATYTVSAQSCVTEHAYAQVVPPPLRLAGARAGNRAQATFWQI